MDALKHEWLDESQAVDVHLGNEILKSLGQLHDENILRKMVVNELVSHINLKHKCALVSLFRDLAS